MVQLRFVRDDGTPVGTIVWFAIHPTSMNNTNTLVSSDNVGYASILFEQRMNPGQLIGKVMLPSTVDTSGSTRISYYSGHS
jgi:neutral ceramidase